MREITATELSRNLRQILDRVEFMGEELLVVRNNHQIARIVPCSAHLTAMEAMADLYETLPEEAAAGWLEDSRLPFGDMNRKGPAQGHADEMRDPWAS